MNYLRYAPPGAPGCMPMVELDRLNPCCRLSMEGDNIVPPNVPPPPRVQRKKVFMALLVTISIWMMVNDTTHPFFPAHERFIVTSHKASYPPWMCHNHP